MCKVSLQPEDTWDHDLGRRKKQFTKNNSHYENLKHLKSLSMCKVMCEVDIQLEGTLDHDLGRRKNHQKQFMLWKSQTPQNY